MKHLVSVILALCLVGGFFVWTMNERGLSYHGVFLDPILEEERASSNSDEPIRLFKVDKETGFCCVSAIKSGWTVYRYPSIKYMGKVYQLHFKNQELVGYTDLSSLEHTESCGSFAEELLRAYRTQVENILQTQR